MSDENHPHTVIIVQARMASTRLPNKVLKEVEEKPLLEYQIERLRNVEKAQEIIVATTNDPIDDEIVDFCNAKGISVERGEEENVLDRYYSVAGAVDADVIVRITADCPLIDPKVVDDVLGFFLEHAEEYDYVANVLERTYPRGMDVEVFSFGALEKAWREAELPEEEEHVTLYMTRHQEVFRRANVPNPKPTESLPRLTVDTIEDFHLIEHILKELYPKKKNFTLDDILATLKEHPDWAHINAHISQKTP